MAVATLNAADLVNRLRGTNELHIIQAREETFNTSNGSPNKRVSDSSIASDPFENATPASLDADLAHYKDLFTKLKFSYLEQVTKEKFLRAITASPPVFIDAEMNAQLEKQIAEEKASLKAQKSDMGQLVNELQHMGADLAQRCDTLRLQKEEFVSLPQEIMALEQEVAALQEAEQQEERDNVSEDPHMQLNLGETIELVEEKESQFNAIEAELERLRALLPTKTAEVERLERELKPLEVQKMGAIAAACEARERKEGRGDGLDDLEARGRWLGAATQGLSQWLELGV